MSPRPSGPRPRNGEPVGVPGCERCAWLEERLEVARQTADARAEFILRRIKAHRRRRHRRRDQGE